MSQLNKKDSEHDINRAIHYIRKNKHQSIAAVARQFSVDRMTLTRRLNGVTRSRAQARRGQQLLTVAEEDSIADWCIRMADLGFPCSLIMVKTMAVHILYDRGVVPAKPGVHWPQRFLERHPEVELRYIEYLERVRAKAATTPELQRWYHHLRSTVRRLKIRPENIWNCDEKGIIMGLAVGRQKAIVRAGAHSKNKIAITDGKREFTTTLETVSATGQVIPPFIIWANKRHVAGFYGSEGAHTEEATFAISDSGYMDSALGIQYLTNHFDKYTTPIGGPEVWRLLIIDGHSSHVDYRVIEAALNHYI